MVVDLFVTVCEHSCPFGSFESVRVLVHYTLNVRNVDDYNGVTFQSVRPVQYYEYGGRISPWVKKWSTFENKGCELPRVSLISKNNSSAFSAQHL